MDWSKDPVQVTPGEFCEGRGLVTADLGEQLTGVVPPADAGSRRHHAGAECPQERTPPATGKVRIKLHVNNLGRVLLRARHSNIPLPIRVRMALTKPNGGPTVAANRIVSIVAHRAR